MNKHVTVLPSNVRGLLDCARYQIEQLESQVATLSQQDGSNSPHTNDGENDTLDEKKSSLFDQIDQSEMCSLSQDELEDALDDGFMIIDLRTVLTKLEKWNQLFPQVKPYFAMKCNPDPMVVKRLAAQHNLVGFDVASWGEIQLALKACGTETSIVRVVEEKHHASIPRLIYANPQRAEQDLKNCMNAYLSMSSPIPLWLTLDGPEELVKIYEISQQQNFPISRIALVLRILVPDHQSAIPLGEKFGAPLEEIGHLVERGLEVGFHPSNFIGTSFHCGSGCHDPETYQLALQMTRSALDLIHSTLEKTAKETTHRCSLIDIGGGFPGWDGLGGDFTTFSGVDKIRAEPMDSPAQKMTTLETTSSIAEAIQPSLNALVSEGYQIIAEPGRFFVEAAACLVCKIYDKQMLKASDNSETIRVYQIAHGVQGVFKDVLLCDESFPPLPLNELNGAGTSDDDDERPIFQSRVLGPSSSSSFGKNDVVCPVCDLPELQIGDWLVFDRMGAYTLSIASRAGRPVICYVG